MARRTNLKLTLGPGRQLVLRSPAGTEHLITNAGGSNAKILVQSPEDWLVLRGELDPRRNNLPETAVVPRPELRAAVLAAVEADSEGGEM